MVDSLFMTILHLSPQDSYEVSFAVPYRTQNKILLLLSRLDFRETRWVNILLREALICICLLVPYRANDIGKASITRASQIVLAQEVLTLG